MLIKQEPLPYDEGALSPYLKAKTLGVHYGKHHRAYIEKTNELVKQAHVQDLSLEDIIRASAGHEGFQPLFNNAAQAWNHWFYWRSMKPKGGGRPGKAVLEILKDSFGELSDFKEAFLKSSKEHFGSGWIWLIKQGNRVKIVATHDADTPIAHDQIPLLTLDVWEHAYYLDYQNRRPEYAEAFLDHLVNWDFVESRLDIGKLDARESGVLA